MPIALSREDFAALAAKNPGLAPNDLLKLASLHNDIRLGSLRDGVASVWDKANTPLDGNALTKAAQKVSPELQAGLHDSPTWAAIKGFGSGALEGAAGVADSFTSPMGLAGLLLGAGEGVGAAKGLAGLAKAAKAGNTALNVGNAAGAIAKASGPNAGMQDYLTAGLSTLPALAGKGGAAIGAELASKRMASEVGAAGPGTPSKLAAEAARKAAKAAAKGTKTSLPEEMVTQIQTAFAKNDGYGKPRAHIGAEKIQALLEELNLPEEVHNVGLELIEKLAGKKVRPDQVAAVLTGEKYDRGRVVRIPKPVPEGETQIPGAPLGTWNSDQVRRLREGYLKDVADGVEGRNWYINSGKSILHHAGDDTAMARKLAGGTSVTSSGTNAETNMGFATKAHNQAVAGMPIKAGRFPSAMGKAIEKVYATEEGDLTALGPKREPYGENLAHGGGFTLFPERRMTHDIWDGESRGYVNPDGTPWRQGFSPAQHAFMDGEDAKILKLANERKLGDYDDWDAGTAQAATWYTSKVKAGDIPAGSPSEDMSTYMPKFYIQEGRDHIPGRSSNHLKGIQDDRPQATNLADAISEVLYDSKGREIAAKKKGLLAGGSFEGPGVWVDSDGTSVFKGRQVQTAVGSQNVSEPFVSPKTGKNSTRDLYRELDPASMANMRANAAEFGILTGQEMVAGTKMDPTAKASHRNMYDVKLGGPFDEHSPVYTDPVVQRAVRLQQAAVMPTPEGMRVLNTGMDPVEFGALKKTLATDTSSVVPGKREVVSGRNQGFYDSNDWGSADGAVGQQYARIIRDASPNSVALFNKTAPDTARELIPIYQRFGKLGFPVNPMHMDLLHNISTMGFDGIKATALKYGLPIPMLLLMLDHLKSQATDDAHSDQQ